MAGAVAPCRVGRTSAVDPQLSALECADGEAAPAVGRPDHGRVHELQDRPVAEGVRDDLLLMSLFE